MDVVCNFHVMASFNHIKYTSKLLNTLIDCACAIVCEACPLSIYNQPTKGGFPVHGLGVRLTVIYPSEMRCLVLVSLCIYLVWSRLVKTVKLRTSKKLYKDKIREFRKNMKI
jgi:hypothetical protein